MNLIKVTSLFVLAWIVTGCASTPGSFAYEVANGSERSKYTKDTLVTQEQMDALEKAGADLEAEIPNIDFSDGSFVYGAGQATDAVTLAAVGGSAAGFLGAMSSLDMAMFGAMSLFDSSHIDRAAILYDSAIVLRKQSEALGNDGGKGYREDLDDVGPKMVNAFDLFAQRNGWSVHQNWAKPDQEVAVSKGYKGTGICKTDEALVFTGVILRENRRPRTAGTVKGDRIGRAEDEIYNSTNIGVLFRCGPESGWPDEKYLSDSYRKMPSLPAKQAWPLVMKLSAMPEMPKEIYFYMAPSKSAFPVPALVNQGEIHWMAKVK